MPHLPPVEITGGSLFIDIPLKQRRPDKEVLFRSVETPEREFPSWKDLPVHSEESEPYPEAHHVHDPVQYKVQRYAAADETTSIYLIEIYGEDETEILEFRPKGKKCSVKIYYAG